MLTILNILIGFTAVILIFALLVTTLSQAIQSLIRLRSRYLRRGIAWLIVETFKKRPPGQKPAKPAKEIAENVVTDDVTWIEKPELLSDLADQGVDITPDIKERFELQFEVMGRYLTDQFTRRMQYISFGLALILAIVFQLSAIELLQRLSTDPEFRAKVDATAITLVAADAPPDKVRTPYEEVSEQAIARFVEKHPEAKTAVEEVSGRAPDRDGLAKEMLAILKDRKIPQPEKLVDDYLTIVDELYLAHAKAKLAEAGKHVEQLASLDITPWPHGWRYYTKPEHWLGVVMSAIFISLGAPFWYNALKNLVNLRDMLKPRQRETNT